MIFILFFFLFDEKKTKQRKKTREKITIICAKIGEPDEENQWEHGRDEKHKAAPNAQFE